MKVFIFGASGFIGKNLLPSISQEYQVSCLVHKTSISQNHKNITIMHGDALQKIWHNELQDYDVIVNLCGDNVARKWTKKIKEEMRTSRALTTKNIVSAMRPGQMLINASAVGYYGTSLRECFDEKSPPGEDFLAQLAYEWEDEAIKAKEKNCRVVIMRMGVVLGRGGALESMTNNFQKFLGGKVGSGKQYLSWIHIEDVVDFISQVVKDTNYNGIYNICSPNPVAYDEFNTTMAQILPRVGSVKIPNFVIKATIGEFAKTIIEGQKVVPARLQQLGYSFKYPLIKEALINILQENNNENK